MNQQAFWNASWKGLDKTRLKAYIDGMDRTEDTVIRHLKAQKAALVCDAGCGCGAYACKMTAHGFRVMGFDVAADAVKIAKQCCPAADFVTADILNTGYPDGLFDAVVCRDVLDHMPLKSAVSALRELLRITKPQGCVLITVDQTDDEYESEPHDISPDGDYRYSAGKWPGMVFHPYTPAEIARLTAGYDAEIMDASEDGYTVLVKGASDDQRSVFRF